MAPVFVPEDAVVASLEADSLDWGRAEGMDGGDVDELCVEAEVLGSAVEELLSCCRMQVSML